MAPQTERRLKSIAIVFVGLGVVVFLVNVALSMRVRSPLTQPAAINYNQNTICPDAFDEDLDFSKKNIRYFDVKLHEGCFGGFVHIPGSWHTWETQPVGDQSGYWIAFWIANESNARGPFYLNSKYNLTLNVTRLQGHGTVRFYTNIDAPVPTSEFTATPENPLPTVSKLYNHTMDPHVCKKPADAYYSEPDYRFPGQNGETGPDWPQFLFDTNHFDGNITWANGFKGKVPVCVLIDENGNPGNISFPQSPGKELEDHITNILMGWHFKGGYMNHGWDPPTPVQCQMAWMFTFE
jgi:hypothetical protein